MDKAVFEQLESVKARLQKEGVEIITRRADRVLSGKFLFTYLLFIPKLARVRALLRKAKEIMASSSVCCCKCHG